MTKTIYIVNDSDSYEVEYDTAGQRITAIWRYAGNRTVKPEFCQFSKLEPEVRVRIEDKLLASYEDPTNGLS